MKKNKITTAPSLFIGVLFVLLVITGPVWGEKSDVHQLEEIIVSGAKFETSVAKTPSHIKIITREEIEKMPAGTSINELIRQVPGLYVPQFQSGVANDGVYSTRGSEPTTWGLRFLVNGIEFNKGNGYTVPTRIPLNDVERIEVIKTPSAEYGDQAVGGVINVITRIANKPIEAKVGMTFGDFSYNNYYAVINGSNEKWEYFADLSFSRGDGYQDGSYYDPSNFYTRIAYNIDETTLMEFHGSHMDSKGAWPKSLTREAFNADPKQSPGIENPFENDYDLAALVYRKEIGDDTLVLKMTGKDEWVTMNFGLDFEFDEWEFFPVVNYTLRHQVAGMKNAILLGAEYRKHELTTQLWTVASKIRQMKIKDTLREDESLAFYFVDELSVTNNLTLTFGTRFDSYEQNQTGRVKASNNAAQSGSAISPKIGATFSVNPALNFFAGYNSGFKSPARIPGASYSADLDPEKVSSFEIGARGNLNQWFSYSLASFVNRYDNKWLKTGPNPNDPYTNAGETEAKGLEGTLGFSHESGIFADVNYTFQKSEYKNFTDKGISLDGKKLPNVPEQMLGLKTGFFHPVFGRIVFTADYLGERYFNKENTLEGDDYWIFGADYKLPLKMFKPEMSFFISASNLTDEPAVVYGSGSPGSESLKPVYGRRILVGIEASF